MVLLTGLSTLHAMGQGSARTRSNQNITVESGDAYGIVEHLRASAPGVLVSLRVKQGETVKKGQILGNIDLDATVFQLDLARHAVLNNSTLEAMKAQFNAYTAIREETEIAVRKRRAEPTRLQWAISMEQFHENNYKAQIQQKKLQQIQYEHWSKQYENRIFRAPVDGVVSEIRFALGQNIGIAAHVFTITNEDACMIPVEVPEEVAAGVTDGAEVPIRSVKGLYVAHGTVDAISDSPSGAKKKLIRLLVRRCDFPTAAAGKLLGSRFSVLLPQPEKSAA